MNFTAEEITRALELWDQLRTGFLWSTDTIEEIIHNRSWEPLSYATFFDAWEEKMADIELAKHLNVRLVVQFLEEGVDEDRILDSVKGLGPVTIANIKRERAIGVPADKVRGTGPRPTYEKPVFVNAHIKDSAGQRKNVTIEVGTFWRSESERAAKMLGLPHAAMAKDIYIDSLKELLKTLDKKHGQA